MMTTLRRDEQLREIVTDTYGDGMVFLDDHDNALLGVSRAACNSEPCMVYSVGALLANLMKDGMDEEEASEWIETNMVGAYLGDHTPIYVDVDCL